MREKHAFFGYKKQKVRMYMSALNTEIRLIEEQREAQMNAFMKEQAELLRQIEEAERDLAEIDRLETSLKQWIQRNQA